VALIVCVLLAIGTAAIAQTSTAQPTPARLRDLLSAAGEDHFWLARITTNADHSAQTAIQFRSQWTGNTDWIALPPIPQRIVSIAASSGNLLVVLSNGQWQIASGEAGSDWPIRTGPTGSEFDEMIAIASNSGQTWAVVRWLPPVTQPSTQPATQPTTQEAAATTPSGGNPPGAAMLATTMPTTEPAASAPKLSVSLFTGGRWTDPHPLPPGVADDASQLSLEVVDGLPVLAWETADGKLLVSRLTAEHGWTAPIFINVTGKLVDFKLLTIKGSLTKGKSVLWLNEAEAAVPAPRPSNSPATHESSELASPTSLGEVLVGDDFSKRIPLKTVTTLPSNLGPPTLVSAFGNLRWIAYAGDSMFEQPFSEDLFPESLPAARANSTPVAKPMTIQLEPWIGGYAMLVVLAGLAGMRQKSLVAAQGLQIQDPDAKLRLAPLGARFIAGLVDLSPILAVIAIVRPANAANPIPNIDKQSLEQLAILAQITYVMHTLIAELICGQSLGKMIFGLRVVNTDGESPKALAILFRNILRIVDVTLTLPLLLVLITPLRQRVGDIAGSTVVIAKDAGDEDAEGEEKE
jgi:uncharacterized RDD family membrane protein YckC